MLVGHYTQLIWSQTNRIGCGKLFSYPDRENSPFGQQFFICNYGLAGNLIKSEMYKVGEACSQCPAGTSCSSEFPGLCTGVPDEPLTVRYKFPRYFSKKKYFQYFLLADFVGLPSSTTTSASSPPSSPRCSISSPPTPSPCPPSWCARLPSRPRRTSASTSAAQTEAAPYASSPGQPPSPARCRDPASRLASAEIASASQGGAQSARRGARVLWGRG